MARKVVIIGANRGIGFEMAKQYREAGDQVIAVCRKASEALQALDVKIFEGVDVKEDSIVDEIAGNIDYDSIDILIHNSGILHTDSYPQLSLDSMREQFEVNTLGPLKTVLGLRSKFKEGSKVGILSSRVGSIADNSSSNNYGYRVSKTAVNMVGKCLSLDLAPQGVAVALLHPGFVRTEMTAGNGLIDANESASGLLKRMDELTLETSGIYIHTSGEVLPW